MYCIDISRLPNILFLAGSAFISACSPGSGEGLDSNGNLITADTVPLPPLSTSFASIQANIFTPNCATSGCHTGNAPKEGLQLDEGYSYAEIVNQPSNRKTGAVLIISSDPDNSYLIQKVEGADGIVGTQMPKTGPLLTPEKIQAIRNWVSEGALDN